MNKYYSANKNESINESKMREIMLELKVISFKFNKNLTVGTILINKVHTIFGPIK